MRSPTGGSRQIIRLIGRAQLEAVATVPMILEYEAVLKRQEHLTAAGLTMEQVDTLIDVFVAEKLATLRTVEYFKERAERANMQAFWEILEQAGNEPPREGDELPETWQRYEATGRALRATSAEGERNRSAELREESRTP